MNSFWKFEKLPDIEGIPQTSVTYYQQVDLKGYIPQFVMNGKIVESMSYLSEIRQKFDKSMEIGEELEMRFLICRRGYRPSSV